MNYNGYEITHFRPDLQEGVLEVLSLLWGDEPQNNLSYFQWKYLHNPYTENVLGIVALHKGKVVGFRGYFAAKWEFAKSKKQIIILSPGDTCVHPGHRRKKLSLIMGNMAGDDYAQNYPLFFNFTANKKAVPGYLRMGFLPITPKVLMNRYNFLGMIAYIVAQKSGRKIKKEKVQPGDFGEIVVSDRPMHAEMSDVISRKVPSGNKIQLYQDENFFKWRFNNNRKKYLFYYYKKGDSITGYIAMRVSENNQRGFIIDYAADDGQTLNQLLAFAIKKKHFDVLSIYTYGVTDEIEGVLKKVGFKTHTIFRLLERRTQGEWPLFIRPVKRDYNENHFFVDGIDIRRFQNWSIKEICSDGA